MGQKKELQNTLLRFIIIHVAVWTLVSCLRITLPMDTLEAIVWGQLGEFGNSKHPPLSGWLAQFFYLTFGGSDFGLYLLSQLCIAIGFIYIFRIGRLFLGRRQAFVAVMVLEGVAYYSFLAIEFNVNVLSLALWPMTAYYFCRAVRDECYCHWLLLGIAVGLNILAKYSCAALFVGMGVYLLASPNGRKQFLRPGGYIALILALLIASPHLIWLIENDFLPLQYLDARSEVRSLPLYLNHLIEPLKFAGNLLGMALPAWVLFFIIRKLNGKAKSKVKTYDDQLLLLSLGVMPALVFLAMGAISGAKIVSMWGVPLLFLVGVLPSFYFPIKFNRQGFIAAQKIIYGVILALALVGTLIITLSSSKRYNVRGSELGKLMEQLWYEKTNDAPLKYVSGEIWFTSLLSLYQQDHPRVVLSTEWGNSPWRNPKEANKYGILMIASPRENWEFAGRQAEEISLEYVNRIGIKKTLPIQYIIVEPGFADNPAQEEVKVEE